MEQQKNETTRQLNYCCIESINGDIKREENRILQVHKCTVTQTKKVDD